MNETAGALVSTVISVYNGARHLAETVESVVNQTYPNIEVIIGDRLRQAVESFTGQTTFVTHHLIGGVS